MNLYDKKCPFCGIVNYELDLKETQGWMECEHCKKSVHVLRFSACRIVHQS